MQLSLRTIVCVMALSATALLSAQALVAQKKTLSTVEKLSDGIVVRVGDSFLKVEVCTDSVIHVTFSKDRTFAARQTLAASPKQCEAAPWKVTGGEPSAGWYDWWTGKMIAGNQTIEAPAPYESMPIYVRAGSLIPVGPELQYTGEQSADPITLYVYAGADGAFTLYEDEGVNYNYEKGQFTRILLSWDNARHTLTIGKREGSFAGMLADRTFKIVLISKAKPLGFSFTPPAARTIRYDGKELKIPL